jgi:glycosyltransferase involved in cell wall biosynthesis
VLAARESVPRSDRVFVADIYDPRHLEQLEQSRDGGEHRRRMGVRHATAVLNDQLLRGDFLLCASEKQRDLWLGQLGALGRVNTATYDADPDLRALLTVAPFGIEDQPPVRTGPGIRGVVPGVGPDDQVVLWGGGIYNWFDPLTLVRAVDRVRHHHPRLRLVFMGMRHPNPDVPEMRMAVATRALSDELGLTGTHVFFNEGWVPYDERQNHLLDADIAVSTHYQHVETAFSFRTRILDYLWASLPVVCTEGDALADLVAREGLGITVPPEDVDALADALSALLGDQARADRCRHEIARVADDLRWARVLEPLVAFCRDPRRAPDHMQRLVDPTHPDVPLLLRGGPAGRGPSVLTRDLALLRRHLAEGGPRLAVERLGARARRLLRR